MERTGKSLLTFLIFLMLGCWPVLAASPKAFPSQTPQQGGKPEPVPGYHVVEKGDTYYGLSRRYQVPVDSLRRWNGENLPLGATIRVSATAGKKTAAGNPAPKTPAATAKQNLSTKQQPGDHPKTGTPKALAPVAKPVARPAAASSSSGKGKPAAPARPAGKPGQDSGKAPASHSNTRSPFSGPAEFAPANKQAQRVLVIPFDPYLYFSDADNDISRASDIPRQHVRHIFRSRLNAFMDPKGFESINLLGGAFRENQGELDRIYKSVSYSYQPVSLSRYNPAPMTEKTGNAATAWLQKQKNKFTAPPSPEAAGNASVAKDPAKYYGVQVKDPDLYRYFNQHYAVDYYLFINQFEIHTDYTNCLDRTQNDFVREFLVHYTIYDNQGTLLAGNKMKVPYISHVNDIDRIVRENLNKMAQRILADLPQPAELTSQARQPK
ncbi:MAG: LysM peptidoglycan-binding domain-containing protein [Adhaeribacter sp.]